MIIRRLYEGLLGGKLPRVIPPVCGRSAFVLRLKKSDRVCTRMNRTADLGRRRNSATPAGGVLAVPARKGSGGTVLRDRRESNALAVRSGYFCAKHEKTNVPFGGVCPFNRFTRVDDALLWSYLHGTLACSPSAPLLAYSHGEISGWQSDWIAPRNCFRYNLPTAPHSWCSQQRKSFSWSREEKKLQDCCVRRLIVVLQAENMKEFDQPLSHQPTAAVDRGF